MRVYHPLDVVLPESLTVLLSHQHCLNNLEDCIPNHLQINMYKYADYCTQDEAISYCSTSNMQTVLDTMNDWVLRNKMELNVKTKDM